MSLSDDLTAAEHGFGDHHAQLRLVTDALPALISYVDQERRYRFNNHAYYEWFGRAPAELNGLHLTEVVGVEAYEAVRPFIDAVFAGQRVSFEATLNYKDAGTRHVQLNYIPDVREDGSVAGFFALVNDFTYRHRADAQIAALNAELRGRLEEFQALMKVLPVGIFVAHDAECTRITMNDAGAAMMRQARDANVSLTGTAPGALNFRVFRNGIEMSGDDLPMQRTGRLGVPAVAEEVDVVFDDGRVTTLYEYTAPLFDDDARVRGVLGAFVDITERKRAEAALRESEERFRYAAEAVNGIIYEYDFASGLVHRTRGLYEVLGYPPGDVPTTQEWWFEQIHPDDVGGRKNYVAEALESRQPLIHEYRVRHRDGRWLHVEDRAVLMTDARGAPVKMVGCTVDVTARKRIEINARFLMEMDEALAPLDDPDAIELTAVTRLGAYLGVDGCNFSRVEGDHLIVRREYRRHMASMTGDYNLADFFSVRAREQFVNGMTVAVENVAHDSRTAALASNYAPGRVDAFLSVPVRYRDRWVGGLNCLSSQPRAWRADEVQLLRDFAARVWPLMEQARATQALREADRRKDEFLAMLAHELRNPLAPIRTAAEVLKRVAPSDANQRWAHEVIERQTQHLTRLVDDLLDMSRITRGKVTLQRESLDLAGIVMRAAETNRALIDARRQHLTVELSPDPVGVEGDPTRLVQIVDNLLNNAAKYTDEGGEIRISAALEGDHAVIRVRDNGMGISSDLLPNVFEPFTQSQRALDRAQGGLGIGLTLVRQLVEMHDGTVHAASEGPGFGSEFVVRLPARKTDHEAEAAGAPASSPASSGGMKILIVEDNVDAAEMMAFFLNLGGHETRTAGDGAAGLEVALAYRPQVVLCDIGLPGMNGYELAGRLRREPELAGIRLIALTGYGQEDDRRRSAEAGFDFHLTKPVEPTALETLLASLMTGGEPA